MILLMEIEDFHNKFELSKRCVCKLIKKTDKWNKELFSKKAIMKN
jgi:hypothetical protein